MSTFQCIIIEDEPLAAEVLQEYIQQTPQLNGVGTFPDAIFALEFLRKNKVDLIFLDIHLPKLKGLDFLRTLSNPPAVILTTAYHQYALESYELEVLDYLLKPIEFERFLKAVQKLDRWFQSPAPQVEPIKERPFKLINVNKRKVRIYLDEILYIESLKEYVRIYTHAGTWLTQFQIGQIEDYFNCPDLIRIHRSYIISKPKIRSFSPTEVEIEGVQLPIGRTYRQFVLKLLATEA